MDTYRFHSVNQKNKISINKSTKENGISRQTFYNNQTITAYIKAYTTVTLTAIPYEIIKKAQIKIRRKDDLISRFVKR